MKLQNQHFNFLCLVRRVRAGSRIDRNEPGSVDNRSPTSKLKFGSTWRRVALLVAFGFAGLEAAHSALVPVNPPDFNLPQIGYYGSWVWPNAGWTLVTGGPGDANSHPCSTAAGAVVKRTGMYSTTGMNIVETGCSPNYYWLYAGYGTDPLGWAYSTAGNTATEGNCFFNLTVGDNLRTSIPGPVPPTPPSFAAYPQPSGGVPFTFDVVAFANTLRSAINAGSTLPVGWQLAVRNPEGHLVYNYASGWVTGNSGLPAVQMTTSRRIDTASMSKTITATALMAALEELAEHQPQLGITLDSSIAPFLPGSWDRSKVSLVTFRSLLRHTSGFVTNGGDSYAALKNMIEKGPNILWIGRHSYYNGNFALLRILIPYLTDGPKAYQPFEANPTLNSRVTAMSYRNYVRGKLFAPLGLAAVDSFYTGSPPETIYFTNRVAIPNNLNIPGAGYNQTASNLVLTAGSGNWTLSAPEYSQFISSLWRGKVISQASLAEMLPRFDPNADRVGMGMYASRIVRQGNDWYNYNHGGGGWLGGPSGIWMTFFNGYTVVFLSNSDWGVLNKAPFQLLEESFGSALTYTLKILSVSFNPRAGGYTVTWASQPGATYAIERSSDLRYWSRLKSGHPSAGTQTSYTDTSAGSNRFYRVVYE
jgi:CubicO group peptidase (beta-lactamase class C family)